MSETLIQEQLIVRKHPYAECEECPLYELGTYVPSTFPAKPCSDGNQLAFVGEAPGENEVKQKKVFIGLSGKVLNGTLGLLGIDRQEALMSNASACHYPKDHFDKLPPKAVEHCRPRLLHELQQAGVTTAVTLGAHAAVALLDTKEGITLTRAGGPRPSAYAEDLLVVPTYHPAYAMRDHTKFQFIVDDIAKVPGGVWNKWKPVNFRVVRTATAATQEIVRFWRMRPIIPLEVDTESGADKDEVFGGAIKDVLCLGIHDEERDEEIVFPREVLTENNRRLLGKLLMRNGLSGQNIKYDICRVINVFLGVDEVLDIQVKGDRMLQSYVLREVSGIHGLDYMTREYLGAPRWKHWSKDSMEEGRRRAKAEAKARGERIGTRFNGLNYAFIDPEILYRYNAYDVAATRRLKDYFDPLIESQDGLPKLYNWLLDVTQMLIHVEQRGMEIDLDYNAQLEAEHEKLLAELDFGENMDKFNPRSVPQVKRFFESVGFDVPDTRKDTIASLVEQFKLSGERDDIVEFCETLLSHRGASKMMSTYIIGLRNTLVDGAAHPDYSLLSSTGRLRCRNPNAQNTPKGSTFRRQYVAREGKIYVHADYGQAELRVMTWLAKDETLQRMFRSPGDIFADMCRLVYPGFDGFDLELRAKCRTRIKTLAYGTAYGQGANSVAVKFGISLREAKGLQATFNSKIPGVIEYQREIKEKARSCEDLITPFGRRRRFRLIVDQNIVDIENEAMAHMPQSTANDICLTSAVELNRQGLPIVNLVHDEIIAEVDKRDREEAARLMRKVMVETAELITEGYVPWKVGTGYGRSYGDFIDDDD